MTHNMSEGEDWVAALEQAVDRLVAEVTLMRGEARLGRAFMAAVREEDSWDWHPGGRFVNPVARFAVGVRQRAIEERQEGRL